MKCASANGAYACGFPPVGCSSKPSLLRIHSIRRAATGVTGGIELRAIQPAKSAEAVCGEPGEPSFTRRHVHIARSGLSQSVHPCDEMYGRAILSTCLNCSFVRSLHGSETDSTRCWWDETVPQSLRWRPPTRIFAPVSKYWTPGYRQNITR